MTESGSAGGQWPWGWGQPGLGAVRLGCGLETGRGLGAGRGSLHPGGRPSWVKTSQESKKPGGHSCSLRFSPAKGLRPRGIGRSSGHSPCSLGSSSFPEKHLMPLKSREQSHQGVPRSPLCPAKSPQNEKEAQGSEHTFTSTGGEGKWGLGYLAKSGWYPPRESLPGMQPCRPSGMGGLYPFKVVSCDVLRAEIPPGGHIPPPHLPRAQEPPGTCANPPGRPCPRRGHSSARVTLARCPAARNTPKPSKITRTGQSHVHPTLPAISCKPQDRPWPPSALCPVLCPLHTPRARQLGTPLRPKAHQHHDNRPALRLISRALQGAWHFLHHLLCATTVPSAG